MNDDTYISKHIFKKLAYIVLAFAVCVAVIPVGVLSSFGLNAALSQRSATGQSQTSSKPLPQDNVVDAATAQAAGFAAQPVHANPDSRYLVHNQFFAEGDAAQLSETNPMLKTDTLPGWEIVPSATNDSEVVLFYDVLTAKDARTVSGGLVSGSVRLGGFYDQHANGRDLPWLTAYVKSAGARPGWGQMVPSKDVRLLYLKAGQGISQACDVVPGQHFAVETIAISSNAAGPNGIRIRFYDADTGHELTNYGAGSNNQARSYPTSWGAVSSRVEAVPQAIKRIRYVITSEGVATLIGPVDVRGGAQLCVYKDIVEAERIDSTALSHNNDAAYDGGKELRQDGVVTVALVVQNEGQGITRGDITVKDSIPEGFAYVSDSVRVYAANGKDITDKVIGPKRHASGKIKSEYIKVDYDDFFSITGSDIRIKPAAKGGHSGVYPMRSFQGPFYGMGFQGFDSYRNEKDGVGIGTNPASSLKVTYKLKAVATRETIGSDKQGKPRDLCSAFTQPSVSFVNLWEGVAATRTNYGPVVRMSVGTNSVPELTLKQTSATIHTGDPHAREQLQALAAQENVVTRDYEDDIRSYNTQRELIQVTKDGIELSYNPVDLSSLLMQAGTYELRYRACDADGNFSNIERATLTVVRDIAPEPPHDPSSPTTDPKRQMNDIASKQINHKLMPKRVKQTILPKTGDVGVIAAVGAVFAAGCVLMGADMRWKNKSR
ncbi:hypothetical protein KPC83_02660 [Collinsella sp. zg1085]|uniref:hypothetical protein n=1 Tax=Collinsella sp. zg1085 TaxID=2844380 RepID=UPI001C0B783C|nr:hypothetical protein [Collinsella sp. zg1085]QWT18054.1 hypothetical protein KPC83_02660 [Collinsella sp. zg1085]